MATTDPIDKALAALALQDPPNYSRTAEEYEVDRSTLSRRYRGICVSKQQANELQSLLFFQQQIELINHINKLSEAGIPPTPAMV
jgi:hypothetical protein